MNNETSTLPLVKDRSQALESPLRYLAIEYDKWLRLYNAQPEDIRRFIDLQARNLAEALLQSQCQTRFKFPERIVIDATAGPGSEMAMPVAEDFRDQLVGGLMERLSQTRLNVSLRQQLNELEASPDQAVATSAGLYRFATALQMVHQLLHSGRPVVYIAAQGDDIPTIPTGEDVQAVSTFSKITSAKSEAVPGSHGEEGEKLFASYAPAARRFYLPDWIAFDNQDRLLVSSVNEAEAHLASMQGFLKTLHAAVALAPYMVADEQYQSKRYGMLGQLINQGRALARYETGEIIATVQRRAAASDLNRGLSLSLPYFDDQDLVLRSHDFDVVPAGRIMFVPGFVVVAARREQAKVDQDTRLSRSTRTHLLGELRMLEDAFRQPGD